jgi:hypothetical protein
MRESTGKALLVVEHGPFMRAILCFMSAIALCIASGLSGAAIAEPADPAINDKPIVGSEGEREQSET